MKKVFTTTLAGRPLSIETGKLAQFANGSVLVRYGDTVILTTATASKTPRDGIDYFPLSVDYEEKLYAVGKIPGGFIKREGRPSEKAILTSRVIDRPMRPLFPKDLRNDVIVNNLVLSVDQDCSPEITAMIGSSAAVAISDIPWNGPIGGVALGLVNGEVVINPDLEQRAESDMYVTLAGTDRKIAMIEAGANEVKEDVMLDAIIKGHAVIKEIVAFINSIVAEIGKEKFEYTSVDVPEDVFAAVKEYAYDKMRSAVLSDDKNVRDSAVDALTAETKEMLAAKNESWTAFAGEAIYKLEKKVVREYLFKEHKRVDSRPIDQIRPLSADVGILPRVHGSGYFSRGQTQVLTICTLASLSKVQMLDGLDEEEEKRYMHHYNFPGYSVGEAKPNRSPGRREIGHGALAERSLVPVLPSEEEFPYAIRLVSEITMSNGSTSQGSVCASTLALMDAGVPIKRPVAGISTGLIVNEENEDDFLVFMDIQGIEDFFGDAFRHVDRVDPDADDFDAVDGRVALKGVLDLVLDFPEFHQFGIGVDDLAELVLAEGCVFSGAHQAVQTVFGVGRIFQRNEEFFDRADPVVDIDSDQHVLAVLGHGLFDLARTAFEAADAVVELVDLLEREGPAEMQPRLRDRRRTAEGRHHRALRLVQLIGEHRDQQNDRNHHAQQHRRPMFEKITRCHTWKSSSIYVV
ncbi:polyribonucleotide nucleotidyltransferase [Candidatus Nomurabacteria bacterium]|nr:polyribonucleotide nucleotidyltransferase [Candidatus Nomurabacteria bacterium]